MSWGPQFPPPISTQPDMAPWAAQEPSRFETAAAGILKQAVGYVLQENFEPMFKKLLDAEFYASGIQGTSPSGVETWKKLSSIIQRGANPATDLSKDEELQKMFQLEAFSSFLDLSDSRIQGALREKCALMMQAQNSLVVTLFPPQKSKDESQSMTFADLANAKEVEITYKNKYWQDTYDQVSEAGGWQWGPKKDSRLPKPTEVGGYHPPFAGKGNVGFKPPTGLQWCSARTGYGNWRTSTGQYIKTWGDTDGPFQGDVYIKGTGEQMATWLFTQSGMADAFRNILNS